MLKLYDKQYLFVVLCRYNISTTDYDRDNTTSENNSPNNRRTLAGTGVDLWSRHGELVNFRPVIN